MKNGLIALSDAPGLGIEIRRDTLERYCVNQAALR